jgi:hypothetical protein
LRELTPRAETPPVAQNSFFAVAGMARARFRGMRTREGCPGIARDSGSRAPIGKRVIIEDRKTDRDPMLPAFHVDGDLHDIPSPALYPGKSRRPRRVKGVRGVQFEARTGLDATFPESVIVGDDDYLVRGVAKAQIVELLSRDILPEYGLGKAECKCDCQPKETRSDSCAHLIPPLKDPGTPVLAEAS